MLTRHFLLVTSRLSLGGPDFTAFSKFFQMRVSLGLAIHYNSLDKNNQMKPRNFYC